MKNQYVSLFLVGMLFLVGACQPKSEATNSSDSAFELEEKTTENRPSPLVTKVGQVGNKTVKVQYGSPSVKGRTLWGDLVPYNVVWRTGANEASFIDLSEEVLVEGQLLAPGKYSIFTIPKENTTWTVVFNSDWNLEHGHFQYNEKNDVLRVEVQPQWEETSQEALSMEVENPGLVIRWGKLKLPVAIQ